MPFCIDFNQIQKSLVSLKTRRSYKKCIQCMKCVLRLEVVVVLVAEPFACRCHCYGTPTHCALSCMLSAADGLCVCVCVCYDYLLLLTLLFASDRWHPAVLLANKIQSQLCDQKVLLQPSEFPLQPFFSPIVFTFASLLLFTFCFIDVRDVSSAFCLFLVVLFIDLLGVGQCVQSIRKEPLLKCSFR